MKKTLLLALLGAALLCPFGAANACAMFSMVSGDTVLMGNNEDYIKPGYIWFVPAEGETLGRVNFGFSDKFAQGSMNEKGLCFDAAVVGKVPYTPDPAKPTPKTCSKTS